MLITLTTTKIDNAALLNPSVRSIDTDNIKLITDVALPYKFNITAVNAGADQLTIAGNHAALFPNAITFTVTGATDLNATYTTASAATFNGTNTIITVTTNIVSITADGVITVNANGSKVNYYNPQKSSNVEYIVLESMADIRANDLNLQAFALTKINGSVVNYTAAINTKSIVSSIPVSSTVTTVMYDMGLENHRGSTEITFTGTVEAINTANTEAIKYNIVSADSTNEVLVITGNHATLFAPTVTFTVAGSTGNNGAWTVSTVTTDNARTYIKVTGNITSAVGDGYITQP